MWQVFFGGAIVLVGVLLAEWLSRLRDRSLRVRANAHELALSTAIFTAYYSAHPDSPTPNGDFSGPYWTLRENVFRQLGELRYLPLWPMRNAARIREQAEELLILFTAVEIRAQKGHFLSLREQAAIHMTNDLHALVFGLGVPPQDRLNKYINEGFDELVVEKFSEEPSDES